MRQISTIMERRCSMDATFLTDEELEQFLSDGLMSQREVDARYLAGLNRKQAKELLTAMREAVDVVPSYVSRKLEEE